MALFDPKRRVVEGVNAFGKSKTPPGQIATSKFPVLTYGETPEIATDVWRLRVWGEGEEMEFTWDDLMAMPQTSLRADFHCVTRWSRFDDEWTGVLFKHLTEKLDRRPSAAYVLQHAYGGYTTNLPLELMLTEDVILAHTFNGEPLPRKHGGPMRVFTPRRYAWKGAKWIHGIEFLARDQKGFWELNGYDTLADPWKEERYG